jgi:peptide/nickel transport system substrate-binding protein
MLLAAVALVIGVFAGSASAASHASGTFVYAEAFPLSTMDPATASLNPDMLATQNMYDSLTRYIPANAGKILPALATSWTQKGKVWTFTLRKGVKFHSGTPFTANDVKVSLDRMLKLNSGLSYLLYDVASVKVNSPYSVTITAKTKGPWLPANLTKLGIVSAKDVTAHAKGTDMAQAWFKDHEDGTGPYKLSSYQPNTQMTLVRNTSWWGKWTAHPVQKFIDRFVTDGNQRFIGLKGGTYQLAAFISTENALSLDKSKFHLVTGDNLWAYPNVNFSLTQTPTSNAKIREALVDSFDYKAMVDYYKGYATTSRGPIPGWVPGSPDAQLPVIKQDIDKAKQLVKESGETNLSFTCLIPEGSPDYPFVGQVLQAGAAQIGIKITLETVPVAQIPTRMEGNKAPCGIYGEAGTSPDPIPFFNARYLPGALYNLFHFKDPKFVSLVKQYGAATSPAKQKGLMLQLAKILVATHMDLWTVSPKTVMPMPNSVTGYQVDPFNLINVYIPSLSYTG